MVGPPHINECSRLGVPIAAHKTEGPSTEATFLDIKIDTIKGELCLSQDKMTRLRHLLEEWGTRRPCTRKELDAPHWTPEPCMQSCEGRAPIPHAHD